MKEKQKWQHHHRTRTVVCSLYCTTVRTHTYKIIKKRNCCFLLEFCYVWCMVFFLTLSLSFSLCMVNPIFSIILFSFLQRFVFFTFFSLSDSFRAWKLLLFSLPFSRCFVVAFCFDSLTLIGHRSIVKVMSLLATTISSTYNGVSMPVDLYKIESFCFSIIAESTSNVTEKKSRKKTI